MAAIKTIFILLVVFAVIGMLAFTTVTMLSMEEQPDPNSTPELANLSRANQDIQKPFLSGFNYLLFAIILALIGVVVVLLLNAMRGKGDGGGGY